MRKPRFSAFAILVTCLALVICVSESISFAVNSGKNISQAPQPLVGSGKLPPGIEKQLAGTDETEFIVSLEASDIRASAVRLRKGLGLKTDSREIIAGRSGLYKKRKVVVMNALAPFRHLILHDYSELPVLHMKAGRAAIEKLRTMKEVLSVEENRAVLPQLLQSLPLINAPVIGAAGSGTSVAVLDTGVDYTRAAFGNCTAPGVPSGICRVAFAQDFAPNDGSLDDDGHGTNVSGIVLGVAPDTKILALDVFRTDGYAYYSDILSALNWVLANKSIYNIGAANMSLGAGRYNSSCGYESLSQVITDLKTAGIVTVVSSGNDGYTNAIGWPACLPDAVSVGAVYDGNLGGLNWGICSDASTAADQVTCFSNSAPFLTLFAPGSEITAAGYTKSGTSMAAPHVAGAVAAIEGTDGTLSADDVVSRLKFSGTPIMDAKSGVTGPGIDLLAAVNLAEPYIEHDPTALYFKVPQGNNPGNKTLAISFRGTGSFGWSVSDDAAWLSLSPGSGTDAGTVTVSVNVGGLSVGTYTATITITSGGTTNSPAAVPVTLEIIDPTYVEDFETGDLSGLAWTTGGDGSWAVQGVTKHSGSYAVKSPTLSGNQSSYLKVTLNVISPGYLRFWTKTSTEPDWDNMTFYLDGSSSYGKYDGWHAENDWFEERSEYSVSAGVHTFEWVFDKDASVSVGQDAVWLDDIIFPPVSDQFPLPSVSPLSKNFGSVASGGTSSAQTFTVSNTGTANLIISTVSFTGVNASQFTKENDVCSGQTLLPSGNCTVDVRFTPSSAGTKSAALSIATNYGTPTTASLSGAGVAVYTLTVNKTGSTGTGRVFSAPSGIDCGTGCAMGSASYSQGTPVTLTAETDANSTFAGWSGGGCSGTGTCAKTMNSTATVTAVFNLRPPVADFTGFPLTGNALLTVDFTDASSNNPASWAWTFGDGGTSTLQDPTHTYENPGVYTVSLTATNAGGPNAMTKTGYINVSGLPLRISGSPPSYYSSLTAAYAGAAGGNIIQGQTVVLTGALDCSRNISVTLRGGYDPLFSTNTAFTTINGSLTITDGTVTVENIVIK